MSQQVLMRSKIPEVSDHCSSMPWLHAPEVYDLN